MKHASLVISLSLLLLICSNTAVSGLSAEPSSEATSRYSVEEATAIALRNNPEIRAAVRRLSLAETKTLTANSLDDPAFMYRDWGTPLQKPWDLNQAQQMFALQQTFPGFGKRTIRTQLAKDEVEFQRAQLESLKREILSRVREAFIDLLRNSDEMRLHDKEAGLLHDALLNTTSKYTVGKVPQADVLRAQVLQTKLDDHLIQLGKERELAQAELNTLMGIDPAHPIEAVGKYRAVDHLPSIVELEQTAENRRPELAGLAAEVTKGEHQTQLTKQEFKPDFTVALGYMLNPPGSAYRNNYMAEFSMGLPWLNRAKHENEVKQAEFATEVSQAELEARRAAVFLEVEAALIKVRAAQKSMKLYRDTLTPQAEATFQAALIAYQNDRTDFLSLIESESMLLDVDTKYFKAAAEVDAELAELERSIGAPVATATTDLEVK